MSLRTRVRGLTTWVNFRLQNPQPNSIDDVTQPEAVINNVLVDLTKGSSLKQLVLSLTGNDLPRFGSLDGLSKQQKLTRLQMSVDEFRKRQLLPPDFDIDVRQVAIGRAEHVFSLIWHLVCHDIRFVAQRADFLRQDDEINLCQVAFRCVPQPVPPPTKRKAHASRDKSSILTQLNKSVKSTACDEYVPFPKDEIMTSCCRTSVVEKMNGNISRIAEDFVLELVSKQLRAVVEGQRLQCMCLDDLCNVRVLCALVNSFVTSLLPTEIFLDDRWAINTVLKVAERIFRMPTSSFDVEDLVKADQMSVCSYFCVFFMRAYRFKQSMVVAKQANDLRKRRRLKMAEMEELFVTLSMSDESSKLAQGHILMEVANIDSKLSELAAVFDVDYCVGWADEVNRRIRREVRHQLLDKVDRRFDLMRVPRDATVGDLRRSMKIDLSLTDSEFGYYQAESSETIKDERKIVLFDKKTNRYMWQKQSTVRKRLGLDNENSNHEIVPSSFPKLIIYFEVQSKHVKLETGFQFLYQVYPTKDKSSAWGPVLRAAIKDDDVEAVDRLTTFFDGDVDFINSKTANERRGDAAIHVACRLGRLQMVQWLLERGADIDLQNSVGETPLHCACDAGHCDVASLLIEWGCDTEAGGGKIRGPELALDRVQSAEVKDRLLALRYRLKDIVPRIVDDADGELLERLVDDHVSGSWPLTSVRCRCIDGSTLLHAAVYFGRTRLARRILTLPGIDVAMLDYRRATPLHRARSADAVKLLLDEGAEIDAVDEQGNSPLHIKAYGESGSPSDIDAIRTLIDRGCKLDAVNSRQLTCLHCAAMQGRVDVLEQLLTADSDHRLRQLVTQQSNKRQQLPSLIYMSLVNDFVDCAVWLADHGFLFHTRSEPDRLLRRLIVGQLKATKLIDMAAFLIDRGLSDPNQLFPDVEGATADRSLLHVAASLPDIDPCFIELLVDRGADLEATDADGETPLHAACRADRLVSAATLLRLGASVAPRSSASGERPLDCVADIADWTSSGLFDGDVINALKTSELRQVRRMVRVITRKVRGTSVTRGIMSPATACRHGDNVVMSLMDRLNEIEANDLTNSGIFSQWCRSGSYRINQQKTVART